MRYLVACLTAICVATAAPLASQTVPFALEVRGFTSAHTFTAAEFAALPHQTVTASAHGVTGAFSGVDLATLLRMVGAPMGDSLRGKALADYVLIEARDGYRVVMAIAELDAGYTDRTTLLVDRIDGHPIGDAEGPLRLIVPGEKRPARWARQVIRISLLRAPGP